MIQEYNNLIISEEFKKWKSKNKDSYLSSCLIMQDQDNKGSWNFGYYILKKNKITTFIMDNEIIINEDQKIFEQSKEKLKEVKINDVEFNLDNVNKFILKEFKDKKLIKTIIVLQYIEALLWNITLLGLDFNLINIKLDSKTGKLIDKSVTSMLQFKAG